jgi:hypothetical protein
LFSYLELGLIVTRPPRAHGMTAIGEIAPIQQVGASKTYNSTPVTGTVRTIKSTAPRQRRAARDDGERGA